MRAEQSKFAEMLKSLGDEASENKRPDKEKAESSSMDFQQQELLPVCSLCHDSSSTQSPLCYLILLQVCYLMLSMYTKFYLHRLSCIGKGPVRFRKRKPVLPLQHVKNQKLRVSDELYLGNILFILCNHWHQQLWSCIQVLELHISWSM